MARRSSTVCFVSSYVPRHCGIATYTHALASAMAEHVHRSRLGETGALAVVAMNEAENTYTYGPEVVGIIRQHRREDYAAAADMINAGPWDVVCVQHEYGLFGGRAGAYLLDLLRQLDRPVVATLHTVLQSPAPEQREVLAEICQRSAAVVVLARRAQTLLVDHYGAEAQKVRLIYHGVPDVPFVDPEPYKERLGLAGRPVILTFGLLSPGKGIEVVVDALARIVDRFPDVAFLVVGETHPGVRRESGESYRLSLENRVLKLGLTRNVIFHNRYVSESELYDYLRAADVYVTPYRSREQIVSGTLSQAVAFGKAVVSTPYWYAQELLSEGRGRLVEFGDVEGFARALDELLSDRQVRDRIRRAAYEFGRQMTWPRVARQYQDVFEAARRAYRPVEAVPAAVRRPLARLSLPELRLDHLRRMTDETGMLQHATFATPNRQYGYCTDDNTRALIVACMVWSLFRDESVLPLLDTYLAFVYHAQPPGGGRFRNFMSYDRRWYEEDASDDCQGRALWSLGYLVSHAPNRAAVRLGEKLFRESVALFEPIRAPRTWAFGVIGCYYFLRRFRGDAEATQLLQNLAARLAAAFDEVADASWPWMEEVVTYDNGRIPQALLVAGMHLEIPRYVEMGLQSLEWLLDCQRGEGGRLSVIGNDGWYRRGGVRAQYDQQPLEPAALVAACQAAYRATADERWLWEMRRCFGWYVGENDAGEAMIDFRTRGCYDSLTPAGPNPNQGAEATLSWLMALLTMYEMQSGELPRQKAGEPEPIPVA